jgi:hypothetical protein
MNSPLGLKDTVQVHYNIMVGICHLLSVLNVSISSIHMPGQRALKKTPEDQLEIQNSGDKATNEDQLESHVIIIYHKGAAITENLDRLVHHEIHKPALKAKLMKDNDWTEEQIESIAWEEFYSALRKVQRSHPISVTKITH